MHAQRWMMIGGALLALMATACSAERKRITAADIAGTVVLETYSVNLGWNYQLRGMYIDGDGGVYVYELHGTPWYPERIKTINEMSERDLLTKHKNAQRIGTVDVPELVRMADLIPAAGRATITRAHPELEGAGTLDVAYTLDKRTHTYTEIILSGTGDLSATNGSGEARALDDYLKEVAGAVGYE
jgi:hypothetical protein